MQRAIKKAAVVNLVSTLFFSFLFSLFLARPAQAQWNYWNCVPTITMGGQTITDVPYIKGLECVFAEAISIILPLASVILFIMLLIGGFKYLTSSGDPKALEGAKGTLTHAIVGLVVLLLAYLVLKLITAITGVDVTNFQIYLNKP